MGRVVARLDYMGPHKKPQPEINKTGHMIKFPDMGRIIIKKTRWVGYFQIDTSQTLNLDRDG